MQKGLLCTWPLLYAELAQPYVKLKFASSTYLPLLSLSYTGHFYGGEVTVLQTTNPNTREIYLSRYLHAIKHRTSSTEKSLKRFNNAIG